MVLETSTDDRAHPRADREPEKDLPGSKTSSVDDSRLDDDNGKNTHLDEAIDDQHTNNVDIEKHANQSLPPSLPQLDVDPNLVVWDGLDDPGNPLNWSVKRRVAITASMGAMTFVVTFSSSIFASTLGQVAEEFQIGEVVATLGVALFLLVSTAATGERTIRLIRTRVLCLVPSRLVQHQKSLVERSHSYLATHASLFSAFPLLWHRTSKQSCLVDS